jgi:hypothetical protein
MNIPPGCIFVVVFACIAIGCAVLAHSIRTCEHDLDDSDLDLHEVLDGQPSLLRQDAIQRDDSRRAPLSHIKHIQPSAVQGALSNLQESLARINLARW